MKAYEDQMIFAAIKDAIPEDELENLIHPPRKIVNAIFELGLEKRRQK